MQKTQYLTAESLESLKAEMQKLKLETIPEIANRINEAKQQGDLSENAEYHQAKEDMAWAQGRMLELEQITGNAQIIKSGTNQSGVIDVGSQVTVSVNNKQRQYFLVGPQEVNPSAGKISNESPLGEAFIGHKSGDSIAVKTPGGEIVYKILDVK